ncbi:hypothetical protein QYF61_022388 [Mycteria americana]|uniref:Uncharacterized protein n=1 Tax=Mycteria americana TaxID=33587 RepID=A0AAN7N087_MYCAM|nr:hypothetical protein QYF61_022388 [Mycteria americana]
MLFFRPWSLIFTCLTTSLSRHRGVSVFNSAGAASLQAADLEPKKHKVREGVRKRETEWYSPGCARMVEGLGASNWGKFLSGGGEVGWRRRGCNDSGEGSHTGWETRRGETGKENKEKGREGKGREGKGREGKGREGKGREGKGREGKGREGKGREGKGRKGKERKGKERKGKERKGKERKGKERKGKERKGKERKGKERKGKERKGKERKGKERKGTF